MSASKYQQTPERNQTAQLRDPEQASCFICEIAAPLSQKSPRAALFCFTARWARPGALASHAAKALNLCSPRPLWSSQTSIWRKLRSCFTHTLSQGGAARIGDVSRINSLFEDCMKGWSSMTSVVNLISILVLNGFWGFFFSPNACHTHCENPQGQRRRPEKLLCLLATNQYHHWYQRRGNTATSLFYRHESVVIRRMHTWILA